MTQAAFDKIAEGLNEALAIARAGDDADVDAFRKAAEWVVRRATVSRRAADEMMRNVCGDVAPPD